MGAAELAAGDLVVGKYRIERELGTGGMGSVFAAVHVQLDQRVALKLLGIDVALVPEIAERFLREARITAKLQSEHAARVIDIATLEDGRPCIVMEYLEGEDLASHLETKGPLAIDRAVHYVLCASEALAEAHALGVVHRDLKPANLFLAEQADGSKRIKIIDFGIAGYDPALSVDAGRAHLTSTRAIVGTPTYMSPEQLTTPRDVDARADIWALGVTLFELLTDVRPFGSGTVPEICAAVLKEEAPALSSVRRGSPRALDEVLARCFEKDRTRRFGNLAELARALLPFSPGSQVSVERITAVLARRDAALVSRQIPSSRAVAPTEFARSPSSSRYAIHTPSGEHDRVAKPKSLLTDMTRVPRVIMDRAAVMNLATLDPRAVFLLSRIDGVHSFRDLLDVCGMETEEALAILSRLLSERVIATE